MDVKGRGAMLFKFIESFDGFFFGGLHVEDLAINISRPKRERERD